MVMKKLKGSIVLILLACSLWAGGRQEDINTRTDYGRFTAVSIRIPADVIIERGENCHIEADIPSRYRGDIEIFNDRGTLTVKSRRRGINFFRSDSIRFIIAMPVLEEVHMSSAGRIRSKETWEAGMIRIGTSSSGDIEINSLTAHDIELKTSSSGSIILSEAQTETIDIRSSSSGDIAVGRIRCSSAEFRTSSSGSIRTEVETSNFESSQTGSGDIFIRGQSGEASIRTTGSGDFEGKDFQVEIAEITITGSGDVTLMEGSRLRKIRITGSGRFSNY